MPSTTRMDGRQFSHDFPRDYPVISLQFSIDSSRDFLAFFLPRYGLDVTGIVASCCNFFEEHHRCNMGCENCLSSPVREIHSLCFWLTTATTKGPLSTARASPLTTTLSDAGNDIIDLRSWRRWELGVKPEFQNKLAINFYFLKT